MKGKWMPMTAGVLDVVNGGSAFCWGVIFLAIGNGSLTGGYSEPLFTVKGAFLMILSVVTLFCSVFAFMRKKWPLALTGAITGLAGAYPWYEIYWMDFDIHYAFNELMLLNLAGVPAVVAIILTILSRDQFVKKKSGDIRE